MDDGEKTEEAGEEDDAGTVDKVNAGLLVARARSAANEVIADELAFAGRVEDEVAKDGESTDLELSFEEAAAVAPESCCFCTVTSRNASSSSSSDNCVVSMPP